MKDVKKTYNIRKKMRLKTFMGQINYFVQWISKMQNLATGQQR